MVWSEKTARSVTVAPRQAVASVGHQPSATAARWSAQRTLFGAALAVGVVAWIVVGPVTKVPLWGDEGQHLTGARHVLLSSQRWFCPVFDPADSQGWTEAEINNCHFPPALVSVYAMTLALFGSSSLAFGTPPLLAHAIAAVGLFVLCRRLYGTPTAWIAVILWLFSPAGFRRGSQIMAEPLLVCFGMLALGLLAEAMYRVPRSACPPVPFPDASAGSTLPVAPGGWALAAGTCLGLAFLMKLWLAGPFVLMALAMLAAGERGERMPLMVPLTVGGIVAGGAHLVVVAVAAPERLSTWSAIYFDLIISRIRPVENPLVTTGPFWHYLPLLYRDHWPLLLPLAVFVWDLRRRSTTWRERAARNLFAAAIAALLVLSIYESKMPLYVYYLAPMAALAAARGVMCLAAMAPVELRSLRPWLWSAYGLLVVATVAAWEGWTLGKFPAVLTPTFCIAHVLAAAWLLLVLLRALSRWRPPARTAGLLVAPLGIGIVTAATVVRAHLTDPARPVARFFAAQDLAPRQADVRFVSPHWHTLGFYLWEQGRPWAVAEDESLQSDILDRFARGEIEFVEMDREYRNRSGALPDAETHDRVLAWLRKRAVDVTPAIQRAAGRPLNTYVFVPPVSAARANAGDDVAYQVPGHPFGLPQPPREGFGNCL